MCFMESVKNMRSNLVIVRPHPVPLPQERVKLLPFIAGLELVVSKCRQRPNKFSTKRLARKARFYFFVVRQRVFGYFIPTLNLFCTGPCVKSSGLSENEKLPVFVS